MNKKVKFHKLGLIDYKKCWDYQESLFAETINTKSKNRKNNTSFKTKNHLIFCEHPNVYTLGKSGKEEHLLLNKNDVSFYNINRGGDITYHGPGQIVGYPILDLDNFFTDIGKYLRLIEEAIILTLKDFGLNGERSKGETGVWIDSKTDRARKICAIGVRTSRWVTMHGFALNVNTDLSYFNNIVPCGIQNKSVTSIENELGCKIKINEVENAIKKHLINLFNIELI